MGYFFSTVVLRWEEPEAFRENQDRMRKMAERWRMRPVFMLIFIALTLIGWGINKLNPVKHPPGPGFLTVFVGCLIAGFVFLYVLPWLVGSHPSPVVLYSNGIMKMSDLKVRYFGWMTGYSWSEEGACYVLWQRTKKTGAFCTVFQIRFFVKKSRLFCGRTDFREA